MTEGFSDFIFDCALAESMNIMRAKNTVVNQERYAVMQKVCDALSEAVGGGERAKIELMPSFCSGSVTIKVPDAVMDRNAVMKLAEVLELCDNFDICPLTDGTVEFSAAFNKVFEN